MNFFAKLSKCKIYQTSVHYLGHIVIAKSVQVDGNKIQAILQWLKPTTFCQLRGFFGLLGYYKKFVQG